MRILFYSNYYVSYSYGIQIEYEFIAILRKLGYEAYNLVFDQVLLDMEVPDKYKDQLVINLDQSFKIRDDDICIYTDVISDNPLNAKQVVRYLLNRPYTLTGDGVKYGSTDFIIAYSGLVSDTLQKCFILRDEIDLFNQIRVSSHDKSKLVLYFGKVELDRIVENYHCVKEIVKGFHTVEVITREVPSSRTETLKLISDASLLISFDPLTNLNYEATLLGVPVYIFKDTYGVITNHFFKYYGITDDKSSIQSVAEEVSLSWFQYTEWLSDQEEKVHNVIKEILKHFSCISKGDTRYINKVLENNLSQRRIDYQLFTANDAIEFSSILRPEELPEEIRDDLGIVKNNGINILVIKVFTKRILRRLHLLNFAKKLKSKVLVYLSLKKMRQR